MGRTGGREASVVQVVKARRQSGQNVFFVKAGSHAAVKEYLPDGRELFKKQSKIVHSDRCRCDIGVQAALPPAALQHVPDGNPLIGQYLFSKFSKYFLEPNCDLQRTLFVVRRVCRVGRRRECGQ